MGYPENLTILNALTAAPTPPARNSGNGWGVVPESWRGGGVEEFELELSATGSNAVTASKLVAGRLVTQVTLADDAIESRSTNSLTLTSHAYVTGDGPVRLTTTGALPGGLSLLTDYWIIVVDANTIQFAETFERAMNAQFIALASDGSGTNTVTKTATTKRVKWLSMGLLGESNDGAVTLTAVMGYAARVKHSPRTVVYGLVGAFGTAVATTAVLSPLPLMRV
jgi:hypothetical protein